MTSNRFSDVASRQNGSPVGLASRQNNSGKNSAKPVNGHKRQNQNRNEHARQDSSQMLTTDRMDATDSLRLPPQNPEAERAFLASILKGSGSLDDLHVEPEWFWSVSHQTLCQTLLRMHQQQLPVTDPVAVYDQLQADGTLEEVGGIGFLQELSDQSSAFPSHYLRIIRDTYRQRNWIHRLRHGIDSAYQSAEALDAFLVEAEGMLNSTEDQAYSSLPDFGFISSSDFAKLKFLETFIIESFLKPHQPCIVAGPSKTLKTTFLTELVVSVCSGTDLLGKFKTAQHRVAFMSAESGQETLQETARRVCASKGIELDQLGQHLFWSFKPPQIREASHILSLRKFIERNRIDVLAIDPAYLSMGLGDDAKNQFVVGEVLSNLTALANDTGVTPILAAHTNKNIETGVELELSHIAYAGFGQWARQWILINRREAYDRSIPGRHRLFISYGGSAGHAGSIALDIEEGDLRDGRRWEYTVQSTSEAREAERDEREAKKAERERQRAEAKHETNRAKILGAMRRLKVPSTETDIRNAAGLSGAAFKPIFLELQTEQTIEMTGPIKKTNGKEYDAFQIINPRELATGHNGTATGQS